jgi:hypothetical protein
LTQQPVWTGVEYIAPTGIQSPNHPGCSMLDDNLQYIQNNVTCS